jgi:hypothetical protein
MRVKSDLHKQSDISSLEIEIKTSSTQSLGDNVNLTSPAVPGAIGFSKLPNADHLYLYLEKRPAQRHGETGHI